MKSTLFSLEPPILADSAPCYIDSQTQKLLKQMRRLRQTIENHIKSQLSTKSATYLQIQQYTHLRAQYYVLSQLVIRLEAGSTIADILKEPFKTFVFTNKDITPKSKAIRVNLDDYSLRKVMTKLKGCPCDAEVIEIWTSLLALTGQPSSHSGPSNNKRRK